MQQDLSDLEEPPGLRSSRRKKREEEEEEAGQQAVCHLLAPPPEASGRETPVSVESIPLEWDHTVDVGRSSHEDDDEASFSSVLSGRGRK